MKKDIKKLVVFVDGGSRQNPGPSAIGVVLCNQKKEILKEYAKFLGNATNNEAEYQAVIFALKKIKSLFGRKKVREMELEILSDSQLLINQLNGKYKILEKKIQELFLEVWNLKTEFGKVEFKLIDRSQNQRADKLVNLQLNLSLN